VTTTTVPPRGPSDEARGLKNEIGRYGWTSTVRHVAREFSANALLIYASAISFRIVVALVPLALFVVALLGFLSLEDVWRDSIAPEVRDRTSAAAFTLIQQTVERILTTKEGFWLTAGALLAFWEVSSAIRITMRALDRVYGVGRSRSLLRRYAVSFALTLPTTAGLLGALAAAQLLPPALDRRLGGDIGDVLGRLVGWGLAAVVAAAVVALLVSFGASRRQSFPLVGSASVFVLTSWAVTSGLFGLYATQVSPYGSVFGGLAFVFVLIVFLNLSTLAFVAGLQLDAHLRAAAVRTTP
jgi:membrane protein